MPLVNDHPGNYYSVEWFAFKCRHYQPLPPFLHLCSSHTLNSCAKLLAGVLILRSRNYGKVICLSNHRKMFNIFLSQITQRALLLYLLKKKKSKLLYCQHPNQNSFVSRFSFLCQQKVFFVLSKHQPT